MATLFSRKKRIVGLDITSDYIRFVEIFGDEKEQTITSYGELPLEEIIHGGVIVDEKSFIFQLQEFKKRIRGGDFVVSLPSEIIRFSKISLPAVDQDEIKISIEAYLKAKNLIGLDDELFHFEFKHRIGDEEEYHIYIAKKNVIDMYRKVFDSSNLKIKSFFDIGYSLVSSCVPRGSLQTFIIVDTEEETTSYVVYDSVSDMRVYHGESVNQSIVRNLNDIYVDWYKENKKKIESVMFTGSNSEDGSLLEVVARETKIPVIHANVFTNLNLDQEGVPIMTKSESYKFAKAIGSALKEF